MFHFSYKILNAPSEKMTFLGIFGFFSRNRFLEGGFTFNGGFTFQLGGGGSRGFIYKWKEGAPWGGGISFDEGFFKKKIEGGWGPLWETLTSVKSVQS